MGLETLGISPFRGRVERKGTKRRKKNEGIPHEKRKIAGIRVQGLKHKKFPSSPKQESHTRAKAERGSKQRNLPLGGNAVRKAQTGSVPEKPGKEQGSKESIPPAGNLCLEIIQKRRNEKGNHASIAEKLLGFRGFVHKQPLKGLKDSGQTEQK